MHNNANRNAQKIGLFSKHIKQQTVAFIDANQDSVCVIGGV